jgi:uncharacterized RDD family membrane protein YckC
VSVVSASTSTALTAAPVPTDVRVPDPDRRFYAFAIDRLIAWGIDVAVAVVCARYLLSRGHVLVGVLAIVGTVLLVRLAFALLVGATGVTPGRSLLGLRLVHTGTGRPIGAGPAVLRTFVLGLAAVPFGFRAAAVRYRRGNRPRGWSLCPRPTCRSRRPTLRWSWPRTEPWSSPTAARPMARPWSARASLRPLTAGRPTTLLEGDVVTLGDRSMTVHRES